jgi:hypothetical protein
VTSVPGADITRLFIATACGTAGLAMLAIWLQDQGGAAVVGRRARLGQIVCQPHDRQAPLTGASCCQRPAEEPPGRSERTT